MEKLILLKRKGIGRLPDVFEIHRGRIHQSENLILSTPDGKFAEKIVNSFNRSNDGTT